MSSCTAGRWLLSPCTSRGLLRKKGVSVNDDLLYSAALLHDIMRTQPDHAKAAMKILLKEGYPAAAGIVGVHMDLPEDADGLSPETILVYLADKLYRRGEIIPVEETLKDVKMRFSGNPEALARAKKRMDRARSILSMLHETYGISYAEISNVRKVPPSAG